MFQEKIPVETAFYFLFSFTFRLSFGNIPLLFRGFLKIFTSDVEITRHARDFRPIKSGFICVAVQST